MEAQHAAELIGDVAMIGSPASRSVSFTNRASFTLGLKRSVPLSLSNSILTQPLIPRVFVFLSVSLVIRPTVSLVVVSLPLPLILAISLGVFDRHSGGYVLRSRESVLRA